MRSLLNTNSLTHSNTYIQMQRLRHPSILRVVSPLSESKDFLAFATEQVTVFSIYKEVPDFCFVCHAFFLYRSSSSPIFVESVHAFPSLLPVQFLLLRCSGLCKLSKYPGQNRESSTGKEINKCVCVCMYMRCLFMFL